MVTPLARRLAGEAGIDLSRIAASGPHGRIVARDVQSTIAAIAAAPSGVAVRAPSPERIKALYAEGTYEEVPLDSMRRTIAARLVEAKQTIPHFYLVADVVIERLEAVRREANAAALPDAAGEPAFRLSLNDFIIKALALALQRVPAANAVWAVDRILRFKSSDIGVAVAIDGGLVTPVIRGAEKKSLRDISTEMKDLAARARARKLEPAELQGGASAVSNRHVRRAGIRRRHQPAPRDHPRHRRRRASAGDRRWRGRLRRPDDGDAVRPPRRRRAVGAELAAFRHFIEHPVGMMI